MVDDPYLEREIKRARRDSEANVEVVKQEVKVIETRVVQVENQVNAANFNYIVSLRSYLQVA